MSSKIFLQVEKGRLFFITQLKLFAKNKYFFEQYQNMNWPYQCIFVIIMMMQNKVATMKNQDKTWVVVVTVSKWYEDIFQNWLYWYNKLSLDMKIILIAEDDFILEKYQNHTLMTTISWQHEMVRFCKVQ